MGFGFITTAQMLGDPLCVKWFRFPINQEYHTSGQFTCAAQLIYKQYSWLQLVITAVPPGGNPQDRTASSRERQSR
ncbi:hypothetical protein [Nostoc sp. NMS4]|uniref:hypothetical protein n=1 Tax=Nostoc sp. NMS4 TaxID=2815390 RepID=UPI0025E35B2B|nr:hypothetical protein [Nostoc sp. NMS4]